MKILFIITLIFIPFLAIQAQNSNKELKAELEIILKKDQELRELFIDKTSKDRKKQVLKTYGYTQADLDKKGWKLVSRQDSLNMIEITRIMHEYGYPGKSLVAEPANLAAWYVIQHSDQISRYFPYIKRAGEENEIPLTRVAMMEDRLLMQEGKEQIYGTQIARKKLKKTGEWVYFIWPVKKSKKVDKLRTRMGFSTTLEESIKTSEAEYKLYSLKEIKGLME